MYKSDLPESKSQSISDAASGAFALLTVAMIFGGLVWFKNESIFEPPQRFSVRFRDAAGLTAQAPVYIDGVRVGVVESVELQGKQKVVARLKVSDRNVRVPHGAEFSITQNGFVGGKQIEVTLPDTIPVKSDQLLTSEDTAVGNDPVRIERVLDKLTHRLSDVDYAGIDRKLQTSMASLAASADEVRVLSQTLRPVAVQTGITGRRVSSLASEMRLTSRRLNTILDDPLVVSDLKETVRAARDTADKIDSLVTNITTTTGDASLREDVLAALDKLSQVTKSVEASVGGVQTMAADVAVRNDLKEIVREARGTVNDVRSLVNKPGFGNNLQGTLAETREALRSLNTVSQQLSQILDKRAPILHMLIARPGKLPAKQSTYAAVEDVPRKFE